MAISLTDPYAVSVLSDNPDSYWRLAENSGTAVIDDGVHPATGALWIGGTGITRRTRHFRKITPDRDIPWGVDFSRPSDPTTYAGGQPIGTSPYLQLASATDTITIEFIFMMCRDVAVSRYFHILARYADPANELAGYNFGICNIGLGSSPAFSSMYFFYGDTSDIFKFPNTGNIIFKGNTYHIVIQKESYYLSYYINGKLVNRQALPSGVNPVISNITGSSSIYLGGMVKNATYTTAGVSPNMGISDIAIYRSPISQSKIEYRASLVQEVTDDIITQLRPSLNFPFSETGMSRVYGKGDNRARLNWSVAPTTVWDSLIKNTYSASLTPSNSFTAFSGGSFLSDIDSFCSIFGGVIEFVYSPNVFTETDQVFLEVDSYNSWNLRLTGSTNTVIGPNRFVCGPDYPQTVQIRNVGLSHELITFSIGQVYYITIVMDPMVGNSKVYINSKFQYEVYYPNYLAPSVESSTNIPYSDGPARIFSSMISGAVTTSYNLDNGGSNVYFFRDRTGGRGVYAKIAQLVMYNRAQSQQEITDRFYKILPLLKLSNVGTTSSLSLSNNLSLSSSASTRYKYPQITTSTSLSTPSLSSLGKLLLGNAVSINKPLSLSSKGSLIKGSESSVSPGLFCNSVGRLLFSGSSSFELNRVAASQSGYMLKGHETLLKIPDKFAGSRIVMIIGAPSSVAQSIFNMVAHGYVMHGREMSIGVPNSQVSSVGSLHVGGETSIILTEKVLRESEGDLSLFGDTEVLELHNEVLEAGQGKMALEGELASYESFLVTLYPEGGKRLLLSEYSALSLENFGIDQRVGELLLRAGYSSLQVFDTTELSEYPAEMTLFSHEEILSLPMEVTPENSTLIFPETSLEKPNILVAEQPGKLFIFSRGESLDLRVIGVKKGTDTIKAINKSPYQTPVYTQLPSKKTTQFIVEVTDFDIN